MYRPADKDAAAPRQAPRGSQAARPAAAVEVTVEVAASARKYIDQALAATPVDSPAVIEAQKLLAEGLLDTPQAIARAAQALIDRGL